MTTLIAGLRRAQAGNLARDPVEAHDCVAIELV
jgi:hypothetical protein